MNETNRVATPSMWLRVKALLARLFRDNDGKNVTRRRFKGAAVKPIICLDFDGVIHSGSPPPRLGWAYTLEQIRAMSTEEQLSL